MNKKSEATRNQLAREHDVPASIIRGDTEAEMREHVESLRAEMPKMFESQRDRDLAKGAAVLALREHSRSRSFNSLEEALGRKTEA